MEEYYQKKIYIPKVNERNEVVGKVERWEAHKKGILHRGFTIALFYEDKIICQHRKHPVFDGYIDFTASSHPIFKGKELQPEVDAVYETLKREWSIGKELLLSPPKLKTGLIYRGKDRGGYIENEYCNLYIGKIKRLPEVNFEYAYGYSLLSLEEIKKLPLGNSFSPWVKAFILKSFPPIFS